MIERKAKAVWPNDPMLWQKKQALRAMRKPTRGAITVQAEWAIVSDRRAVAKLPPKPEIEWE